MFPISLYVSKLSASYHLRTAVCKYNFSNILPVPKLPAQYRFILTDSFVPS
jgi:hypothetical protein